MNQFWAIIALFTLSLLNAPMAKAQSSLAQLSNMDRSVALDWRNPALVVSFNLPPNPGPASLTVKANPLKEPPLPGSYFLLSINQQPALPFSPVIRGFSARFDIAASQLRPGNNQIELSFVPGSGRNCLSATDGGWSIDLQQSRFDLALGRQQPDQAQFEHWLAADIGSPSKIFIGQQKLSSQVFQEFGALVSQALGLRMKQIPQLTLNREQADLVILPRIDASGPGLWIEGSGTVPALVVTGSNQAEILIVTKWFSQNLLSEKPLIGPIQNWTAKQLTKPNPLRQLIRNTHSMAWQPTTRHVAIRLPRSATARLRIEARRPALVDRLSRLKVMVDHRQIAAPSLWRRVNSLSIQLPTSQSSARKLALVAALHPQSPSATSCLPSVVSQNTASKISLDLAGMNALSALDHLAWNGGVFTKNYGQNVQFILPERPTALIESWRFLAHLARIGGASLTNARFGGPPDADKNLLIIASRANLPPQLADRLPASFAKGAGRAPGDPYPSYQRPRLVQSAFAANPNQPAMGIIATARLPQQKVWMAISTNETDQLAAALNDLVSGTAFDQLAGTVVRWRGSKVEINATNSALPLPFWDRGLAVWQILLYLLLPTGLWSVLYLAWINRTK